MPILTVKVSGRPDATRTRAIADLLLAHYAQRRPTVSLRLVSSDTDHLLQILTRTISDMISIGDRKSVV
jgi:hypothetical protein